MLSAWVASPSVASIVALVRFAFRPAAIASSYGFASNRMRAARVLLAISIVALAATRPEATVQEKRHERRVTVAVVKAVSGVKAPAAAVSAQSPGAETVIVGATAISTG